MRGCAGQPPHSGVTSMKVRDLHSWDVSPTEARRIQSELRGRLQLVDDDSLKAIKIVAGVDNTYVREDSKTTAYAVVVALSFPALDIIETAFGCCPVDFPYIPVLLSSREAPTVLEACRATT